MFGHALATPLARAAVCADQEGRFADFHSLAFRLSDSLEIIGVEGIVERVGLAEVEGYVTCISSDRPDSIVADDVRAADSLGIVGTPTFLLDSLLFAGVPRDLANIVKAARRWRHRTVGP